MAEPARIWVVDDDRAVRFVLATALRDAGFEVTAFAAAAEALDALQRDALDKRGAPALVVTDVRMPGDSGLQLLDKLKAARPDLPVIVMSAHTDVASTAGAFRGGAHEFLSKPFDLDEAVALVRRALPQREARAAQALDPEVDIFFVMFFLELFKHFLGQTVHIDHFEMHFNLTGFNLR